MRNLLLAIGLVALGCRGTSEAPEDPQPTAAAPADESPAAEGTAPELNPTEPGKAPTPFTAAQIREATPKGRRYNFRMVRGDGTSYEMVVEFVAVDADGCTIRSSIVSPSHGRQPHRSWVGSKSTR